MASAAAVAQAAKLPWPVAVYLFCVVVPIGFQAGPLAMTTLRLFLLVMTVPLMIRLLTGAYGRVFVTDILFILHILWATVALAVNNPDQVIQQMGSVGIEFLGGYAVGRAYIRNREDFVALCKTLVVVVLCLLPFAVLETLTGRTVIVEVLGKLPGLQSVAITPSERRLGLERVQASFAHPIHFGLFCSIAFSLAFVTLHGISSTLWRYVSSFLIACAGFLALSSGALLAIFLQIALIAWAALFSGFRHRWWLLVALFVLAYVVVDILSNRAPVRVFMSYATFSPHNAYWRGLIFEWGMKSVWGSPFFGIGLDDWVRPAFMYSASVDNFWLLMAMRYGIPGFFLIALGYILVVLRVMRLKLEADTTLIYIRRAWVFTFLGISFTLCTVHIWTNIYSFVFFMMGAGLWLISATPGLPQERPAALRQARSLSRGPAAARTESVGVTAEVGLAAQTTPTRSRGEGVRFTRFARDPRSPADKTKG
jgi:O-antigen ligase